MKQHLWVSLSVAISLGFAACSQDSFDRGDKPLPDAVETGNGFFGFRLENPEIETRDTHKEYDDDYERYEWFNKGTADERAIIENPDCNRVFFFNQDYSFFGAGKLGKPENVTVASNIYVAQKPGNSSGFPAYALVVVNGDSQRLDNLTGVLQAAGTDAVKTVLNYINKLDINDPESLAMAKDEAGKKYFTMTSNVYSEAETGKLMALKELDPEGPVFFETVEEALLPENLTVFHVERLLAKFTLIIRDKDGSRTFNNSDPIIVAAPNKLKVRLKYTNLKAGNLEEDDEMEGNVNNGKDVESSWRINLVNWGLNALEKNTLLVKSIEENPTGNYPWTVSENFYIGWNSPVLERSFWAIDENYSSGFYPDQYRQSLDIDGVEAATSNNIYSAGYDSQNGLEKRDYTLVYKPYSSYTERSTDKYSVENTFNTFSPIFFSADNLATEPWLRCGTHILLTAQMIIDEIDKDVDFNKIDASGFIPGVQDKFFSNGLYWTETSLKEQALATLLTNIYYNKIGNEIKNVLGEGTVEFINNDPDNNPVDDNIPVAVSSDGVNFIPLSHEDLATNAKTYFEFAPCFIKGGDGWVSLKLKDGYTLYKRVASTGSEGTVVHKPISNEQLVSYIYRFTNLAKHYKEGRMYYALPIRHNLDSRSFEEDPVTRIATGDYGVVRNTWYRLTLNSIDRPGTPVDDPDQPIIPNPEPDQKSLGVEVEIIPWETVEFEVNELH